jgi:hypothetical protein
MLITETSDLQLKTHPTGWQENGSDTTVISLANMPLTCCFKAQGILSNTCHESSNLLLFVSD